MKYLIQGMLLCAMGMTLGCDSSSVRVQRFIPTETHVHNSSPLAIGSIGGPDGDAVGLMLESALGERGFSLVSSPVFAAGLRRNFVREDDLLSACDVLREVGGGRLLVGEIIENSLWPSDWQELAEEVDRGSGCEDEQLMMTSTVRGLFRVIDAQAKDVIASAAVCAKTDKVTFLQYESFLSSRPEYGAIADANLTSLRVDTYAQLATNLADVLTPRHVRDYVTLFQDVRVPESAEAVKLARRGEWFEVISLCRRALTRDQWQLKRSRELGAKLHFNLAMALGFGGYYAQAFQEFARAREEFFLKEIDDAETRVREFCLASPRRLGC